MSAETSSPTNFTTRLDRLERQNRTLRWAFAGILGLGATAVLVGAATRNRTIDAEELILRSPDGRPRIVMRTGTDGMPILSLLDGSGARRAALGLTRDGMPTLKFLDQAEKVRISMSLIDGAPNLRFMDRNETPRVALGPTSEDGKWSFSLHDAEGRSRFLLALERNGTLGLGLLDESEAFRVAMALPQDGEPALVLYDTAGNITSAMRPGPPRR